MPKQSEQLKSPILRLSQKELSDMVEQGEVKIVSSKEQSLVASETKAWQTFLGKKLETPIPPPPRELLHTMEKAKEIGWTKAEVHYLPKLELKQDTNIPGWPIRPNAWYWEKIEKENVTKNAATLEGIWIIIDGTPKPDFHEKGVQLYVDDPFGDIFIRLRNEKKIRIPDVFRHISPSSRFCISPDELESNVLPAIANLIGASSTQVRLPKAIEFNILGNMFHPEWGQTDTREWFADKLSFGSFMDGGSFDDGGLVHVSRNSHDFRINIIGFRPVVVFPQIKS